MTEISEMRSALPVEKSELLTRIRENLRIEIERRGISERQLSLDAGLNPGYVSSIFERPSVPNLANMMSIANAMLLPIDALTTDRQSMPAPLQQLGELMAEFERQNRSTRGYDGPAVQDIQSRVIETGGDMSQLETLIDHLEFFEVPDPGNNDTLMLSHMGRLSLAARELRLSTTDQLSQLFTLAESSIIAEINRDHRHAAASQTPTISRSECIIRPAVGYSIHLEYLRLHAAVSDSEGRRFILHYSKPVRRVESTNDQLVKVDARQPAKPIMQRGSCFRHSPG